MDSSCFCIGHQKASQGEEGNSSMELDAAAAVTEMKILKNRQSKFKITPRKLRRLAKDSYFKPKVTCNWTPIQMNSKFVTNFSVSRSSQEDSDLSKELLNQSTSDSPPEVHFKFASYSDSDSGQTSQGLCKITSFNKRNLRYKPYPLASIMKFQDIPSQLRLEDLSIGPTPANVVDRASSPAMPRQDSGNKSNPSSPAKSQSCRSSGSSLVRSRSLDDLEKSKLEDSKLDCYSYGCCDIDIVSQHISKLHVS